MGASYTLHLPRGAEPGDASALDRADLVRDGFSWGAFLVPAFWFLRHRHWWLALGAALAVVGTAILLHAFGFGLGTIALFELLLHALLGLEGSTLRRWALGRRGRPVADVVLAGNIAEAEAKSFARWLAPPPSGPSPGRSEATPPPRFARNEPILGLFPDLEGRR